jgi:hypothetical protein
MGTASWKKVERASNVWSTLASHMKYPYTKAKAQAPYGTMAR